ncbi:response regulator [Geojedonia litorea]|uniref:Response regulator n=1 Tax=Geojedonia litorea TaxID=1268269 RepID=A0ABV9N2B0_9FLAO
MTDKILVIDDDPIIRKLTQRLLKIAEFSDESQVFTNGFDALVYLKQEHHSDVRFVIFLDINMPKMNGWEFLEQLEKENFDYNMSIFLITSSVDQNDHFRAKVNTAVRDIITKPFTLKKLKSLKSII